MTAHWLFALRGGMTRSARQFRTFDTALAMRWGRNPIRIWDLGEGFTMMVGANAAAIIFEVGHVQGDTAVVIVHAMRAREKY
ncbi:MAG: hypothetical protein ACR2FV_04500, partial [Ornithinimicrobium sp.]|uniref:hypothetical protein n=1 Tax=Ornithinimicrobium sp. TaxID=1977084 RepID=UPI003D9B8D7C